MESFADMIEAVIFDFDGVLVDSEVISLSELHHTFQSTGIEITWHDLVSKFLGRSSHAMEQFIEKSAGVPPGGGYAKAWNDRVCERFVTELEVVPGTFELLDYLKRSGIACSIASGSSPERLEFAVETAGLKDWFDDTAFSVDLVENGKPAPDIFLYAAEKMGVAPENCMVIEDGVAGIVGAGLANVAAIAGFVGGSHLEGRRAEHYDLLVRSGATHMTSSLSEIEPIIAKLRRPAALNG